jgi:hypothetical protein
MILTLLSGVSAKGPRARLGADGDGDGESGLSHAS